MTSIAERSAWIIVMLAIASRSVLLPGLAELVLQVRRHVPVDVLEHRLDRRRVAVEERTVLGRFLERSGDLHVELLRRLLVLFVRPRADRDQMLLQARDGVAEREMLVVVAGPVARRIVRGRVRSGAIRDPLDQRRPEIAARPLGGPCRRRIPREEVVAVDAQRRDAAAAPARPE